MTPTTSPLADPPSNIVATFLCSQPAPLVTNPLSKNAWPIYVSELPDGAGIPTEAVAVYDPEGMNQARLLGSGKSIHKYGIQIVARGNSYQSVYALLTAIKSFLERVTMQPVAVGDNSYMIDTISSSSPVMSMGQDELRRSKASINMLMLLIEP